MENVVSSEAGDQPAEHPRSVIRGWNLQLGYLGADSLYLVVEYPHVDVYQNWANHLERLPDANLRRGITVGDMLLERGGLNYKLKVRDGDARMYMTELVEDELLSTNRAGQGMGLMLQLGPKWLTQHGGVTAPKQLIEDVQAQLTAFGVPDVEHYRIRVNRLDVACDVMGLKVADLSLEDWRQNWVGRARKKRFFDSSDNGLETIAIGSREAPIYFKVYDKIVESIKDGDIGFWRSVWGLPAEDSSPVARFEWAIRVYEAKFVGFRYLHELTFERVLELLNYLSLEWGWLAQPVGGDSEQPCLPMSPLWETVRQFIEDWGQGYDGIASRDYDFTPDLNLAYLKLATGWIVGLLARLGLREKCNRPILPFDLWSVLEKYGVSATEIDRQAWQRYYKYAAQQSGKGTGCESD